MTLRQIRYVARAVADISLRIATILVLFRLALFVFRFCDSMETKLLTDSQRQLSISPTNGG